MDEKTMKKVEEANKEMKKVYKLYKAGDYEGFILAVENAKYSKILKNKLAEQIEDAKDAILFSAGNKKSNIYEDAVAILKYGAEYNTIEIDKYANMSKERNFWLDDDEKFEWANLEGNIKTLANGVRITRYKGGSPENYLVEGEIELLDDQYLDVDDIKHEDFEYVKKNNQYKILSRRGQEKVKIELADGIILEGLVDKKCLDNPEHFDVIPITKEFFEYNNSHDRDFYCVLVNLKTQKILDELFIDEYIDVEEINNNKFFVSSKYESSRSGETDRYINLETMEPLKDEKGKVVEEYKCCKFHKNKAVMLTKWEGEYESVAKFKVIDTKGKVLLEEDYILNEKLKFAEDELAGIYPLEIIYEKGEFYRVDEKCEKTKVEYDKPNSIDPMN